MLPCGILTCCTIVSSLDLGSLLPTSPPAEKSIWDFSTSFIPRILSVRGYRPKDLIDSLINLELYNRISICFLYSSCVACVPPPLALVILLSPWGQLTLRDIRADSLMLSCHVKVTSHPFLIPLLFAAMIPFLAAPLSCLPLRSVGFLSHI